MNINLYDAAERYRQAAKDHAEAFLLFRRGGAETDKQAIAMADIDVDLVGAMLDWELARARFQYATAIINAGAGDPSEFDIIEGGPPDAA